MPSYYLQCSVKFRKQAYEARGIVLIIEDHGGG